MCFSATASFLTAAATGAAGIACLIRAPERRELPLAAVPAIFAVQQAIEGLLWLTLPDAPEGAVATALSLAFLLIATVIWPVYAPVAALLVETVPWRGRAIAICLATGAGVALTMLWTILSGPHSAAVAEHHVVYVTALQPSATIGLAYLAATGVSLLLSSRPAVTLLGVLVMIGSATAFVIYWDAFTSVWCFFAAAASLVILGHFEWSHRRRGRIADA